MKNKFIAAKSAFNSLPSPVKIIVYSGISTFLGKLLYDLETGGVFNWHEYLTIPVGVTLNVILFAIANEKKDKDV